MNLDYIFKNAVAYLQGGEDEAFAGLSSCSIRDIRRPGAATCFFYKIFGEAPYDVILETSSKASYDALYEAELPWIAYLVVLGLLLSTTKPTVRDKVKESLSIALQAFETSGKRPVVRKLHIIPNFDVTQSYVDAHQNPNIGILGKRIDTALNTEDGEDSISVVSILFLAADPTDTSRLRLGEEFREIQEKLQSAKLREKFQLHQRMSVRPADISQALLDVQPQIIHFSGHGTATGALCFEDKVGKTQPVEPDALAALFEQFADQINCVLLNACYSETQANAIVKHVDYVIGMNQAIGDKAAIAFTIGFYQALGAGRTIEDAYNLGCVQIRLQGIAEHLTPVLIKKGQTQL